MIDPLAAQSPVRTWIVCESGNRWLQAVRRFAPHMMPPPLTATSLQVEPAGLPRLLQPNLHGVLVLEVRRQSMRTACDLLALRATAAPGILPVVAGSGLSAAERIVLLEFQCAVTIRHPEDLPRLSRLFHGYFATSREYLD
jgi:hypothetical protein